MKVKCMTDRLTGITKGKSYDALEAGNKHYIIIDDAGNRTLVNKDWLSIPSPETQIEVGSEWVATLSKQGEKTLIVLHVGQQMSLCKWVADGGEFSINNAEFNTKYKPKPKTVTMYFYKDCKGLVHSYSEVMPVLGDYLFTREVEL